MLKRFGEEVVTELCTRLIEGGAPGLALLHAQPGAPTEALWRSAGAARREDDRDGPVSAVHRLFIEERRGADGRLALLEPIAATT